jgi:Acetyltransferase (GNAT) domain
LEPQLFDAPPDGWNALVASDPNATPSHRPEVGRAFAAALRMEMRYLAVTREVGLEGGAPVMLERRGGFHWIHAMPMMLAGAPLAHAGQHAAVDVAVARGLGALQRRVRAVGGEWTLYRPYDERPAEAALAACSGETRTMESALIDLRGGIEAARRRMDRKTRQDIRRVARRLRFGETPEALEEAYAYYARQAREWGGHRPLPIELSRRLLTGELPGARLFTVRDARGLLSAVLALDHPRELMLWWSGSHPDARRAGAFPMLLWSIIEWASAAGRERVNLGASAGRMPIAEFKHSLGARGLSYPVRWLDARHATPLGHVVAALQNHVRRGRDRGAA